MCSFPPGLPLIPSPPAAWRSPVLPVRFGTPTHCAGPPGCFAFGRGRDTATDFTEKREGGLGMWWMVTDAFVLEVSALAADLICFCKGSGVRAGCAGIGRWSYYDRPKWSSEDLAKISRMVAGKCEAMCSVSSTLFPFADCFWPRVIFELSAVRHSKLFYTHLTDLTLFISCECG